MPFELGRKAKTPLHTITTADHVAEEDVMLAPSILMKMRLPTLSTISQSLLPTSA
jgi:hypothetical protein